MLTKSREEFSRSHTLIAILMITLLCFFYACSSSGTVYTDEDREELPTDPSITESIFPHDDGWEASTSHGLYSIENGYSECLSCHNDEQAEDIVTCQSCHATYPHNWIADTDHSQAYLSDPTSCQTQCHSPNLDGGDSGVSCLTCHQSYPHGVNWADPTADPDWHGSIAEFNKSSCQECHGTDFTGGNSEVSCYSCHELYPHEDTWTDDVLHGTHVLEYDVDDCTTNCHGTDLRGGLSNIGCTSCHATYPHDPEYSDWSNWEAQEQHGSVDISYCSGCHGEDYLGGNTEQSCFECHADFPHTVEDWAEGSGHGSTFYPAHNSFSADVSCWNCHGDPTDFFETQTLNQLQTASDCHDCHWAYPHVSYAMTLPVYYSWDTPDNGHDFFIMTSDLLVDENGYNPLNIWDLEDPQVIPAVENTCGGSASNCHFDGNYNGNLEFSAACEYCHP